MEEVVRQDIMEVLGKSIPALRAGDGFKVKELSNNVVHNASVFQDEDSIAIAVLLYALSKIMERGKLDVEGVAKLLERAKTALEKFKFGDYKLAIQLALREVAKADSRLKIFVGTVIEQAQIKKGCKICMHGISVARTAQLLGLSRWDLMQYLGQTSFHEEMPESISTGQRLDVARRAFSG